MRNTAATRGSGNQGPRPVFMGTLLSAFDSSGELPGAFEELRVRFEQARALYEMGDLSAEKYAQTLAGLRCFDAERAAWTIGASTERWYKLVGRDWVQTPPPYQSSAGGFRARSGVVQEPLSAPLPPLVQAQAAGAAVSEPAGGMLFGLPEQLFASEPAPPAPVPHGALPDVSGPYPEPPLPRSGQYGDDLSS